MNTITLQDVTEELLERLRVRAQANGRSMEAEAMACLEAMTEAEEIEATISDDRWPEIEQSLVEGLKKPATQFTEQDWQHFRKMARGKATDHKDQ